jgi:hypothetical protein
MEMVMDALEDDLEIESDDDRTFYFVARELSEETFPRIAMLRKNADSYYLPSLVFQVRMTSYRLVFIVLAGFVVGMIIIGLSLLITGAEMILAAGGWVISTGSLLFLER